MKVSELKATGGILAQEIAPKVRVERVIRMEMCPPLKEEQETQVEIHRYTSVPYSTYASSFPWLPQASAHTERDVRVMS